MPPLVTWTQHQRFRATLAQRVKDREEQCMATDRIAKTIYFSKEVSDKLDELAKDQHRSVSNLVEVLVMAAIQEEPK